METKKGISRGNFIKLLGIAGGASIISACERVINPPQSTSTDAITPEVNVPHSATPTETTQPTATLEPTANPTPTETIEPVVSLTDVEFQAKSDEELKIISPKPKIEELGFPVGTQLSPDTIIRGGEGANYILYKNPQTTNIELAWNAETGIQEHAIYSTYEKEINGEVCKGIPCLFLTNASVLEEEGGGGWFGLNPDFPDAQDRVGRAFNTALGIYYWCKVIRPTDYSFGMSYDYKKKLPDFSDIPGYANLTEELENIYTSNYFYDTGSGPLRERIGSYMSDKFLFILNEKRKSGDPMEIRLKAVRSEPVDLVEQKLFIINMVCSGKYQRSDLGEIFDNQYFAFHFPTLKFITQMSKNPVTLDVDFYRYDKTNYLYGGHLAGFMRYFFGDYLYSPMNYSSSISLSEYVNKPLYCTDYTTGVGTAVSPPERQGPEILQLYNLATLPTMTANYSISKPFPGQNGSFKFYRIP